MNDKNKIRTVIIDDEKWARETLKEMILRYCATVEVIGEADSSVSGYDLVKELQPELIFLDVEMPFGTGFDLLNKLGPVNAEVIFTTAHNHYALKAIKISALDYLLKPIDKDELVLAVSKFKNRNGKINTDILDLLERQLTSKEDKIERLAIPSLQGFDIIFVKDILYCEGNRNYTTFYLVNRDVLVASKTLKEYESLLPTDIFIRVHQKYLVNINYVKKYVKGRGGTLVMMDGKTIDVSHSKKSAILDALN